MRIEALSCGHYVGEDGDRLPHDGGDGGPGADSANRWTKLVVKQWLFVYGTLMPSATDELGKEERIRLQCGSISIGAATARGRLYDLGGYPALVPGDNPDEQVHGEAVEIADPVQVFRWLDVYEGIGDERGGSEYVRVVGPVTLAASGVQLAWMYVYREVPPNARLLQSGHWIGGPAADRASNPVTQKYPS